MFPALAGLGFNPYMLVITLCFMTEIASITPPIGMNVVTTANVLRTSPARIFRGVLPCFLCELAAVFLMALVPQIVTFLPSLMGLDELTEGAITVNFMWGGTVYNDMSQFTALRDGAINMISIQTTASADYVPYMSFAHYGVGIGENALNLWKQIMFENPETSELITAEAEANSIKYLNAMDMGSDVIVSNFEWSTLTAWTGAPRNNTDPTKRTIPA